MRIVMFALLLFSAYISAQDNVVQWLDNHAVPVTTNSGSELKQFSNYITGKADDVKIFGFGEASHHHKEFTEINCKIFKTLVQQHGVKALVLEESFGATYELNKFLQGNTTASLKDLVLNLRQGMWHSPEMYALILWIKQYNDNKPAHEKVTLYGMDNMFNNKLTEIITGLLSDANIPIDNDSRILLDYYKTEQLIPDKNNEAYNKNMLIIDKFRNLFLNSNLPIDKKNAAIRAVTALKNYSAFMVNPNEAGRDKAMAATVEEIVQHERPGAKLFVWAHNTHIGKTVLFPTNIPSMGSILFKTFGDAYYSVGSGFGAGELMGQNTPGKWETYLLEEPIKNTAAEIFYKTKAPDYFFDFKEAVNNAAMKKFLEKKSDYLHIGGYGVTKKYIKYNIAKERFTDMYDGFVFIKDISLKKYLNK